MSEKLYEVIDKLERTKSSFKSKAIAEAKELVQEVLNDPMYSPNELAWAVQAIGYEMTGRFEYNEIMAICDDISSHIASSADIRYGGQMLAAEIEDGCAFGSLEKNWKINGKRLAEKLKALSDPQAWWLAHQVRVWTYGRGERAVNDGEGGETWDGDKDYTMKLFRIRTL